MGLQGVNYGSGEFLKANFVFGPSSVNTPFFVASRSLRVKAINVRVEAAGTDVGAVTAIIRKAASGTALTAGTALHTGTLNLKGTAATNQPLTLSATDSDLTIAPGTCIAINFTGVLTAASGCVTIIFCPL